MTYRAPIAEQLFQMNHVADLPALAALPGFESATPDLVEAILEEAGKLAQGQFAPLNVPGDKQGAKLTAEGVTLPEGFKQAYATYVEGGWASLNAPVAHGGQGLPFLIATAVQEQLTSANMAFSLCMMLSQGAIEAMSVHASAAQQKTYLEKMISGQWSGTMNLTEPQAGSDVGALKTQATPAADGTWRIKGQKIYITWGDHDVAENIIHLVLARTPGAPAGTKGISLFIVPKYLVNADGSLGARNDVRCVGLEHKLGIHASPTCTMAFGEEDNCIGYMVGAENTGMRAMFTMMNHARISVGLQGVAIAERATQAAFAYARDRQQMGPIVNHMDVRRMLMRAKATTEAIRALTYLNAAYVDRAHSTGDADAQGLADLLVPLTKAYNTDMGTDVASLAIQVHGGMGFIEDTGVAQHYRDIRIAAIYEGTNGIQAMDLVGRKLGMDGGRHWQALVQKMHDDPASQRWPALMDAIATLGANSHWLTTQGPEVRGAVATPYLRQFATTVCGWAMARQYAAASSNATQGFAPAFLAQRAASARFYIEQLVPEALGLSASIRAGAEIFAEDSYFAA